MGKSAILRARVDLSNATLEEIEERYAERIPNSETLEALNEDLSNAPRYDSAEMLEALRV